MGSRLIKLAALACLTATVFLLFAPSAQASPSITAVNPPNPVLAGQSVFVNANNFPATSTVNFELDGTLLSDTAMSDAGGTIAGAAVTIPIPTSPGAHSLTACSPVSDCAPPVGIQVGPLVSTGASMPVHRGQSISVTIAGLQAFQTAIFGWNGVFTTAGATSIPDQPSFTVSVSVPSNAPASSTFNVCEQSSWTSCITSPATNGSLHVTVSIPAPPPPPPHTTSHPPPTPTTSASASPSATPTKTHAKPTPSPTPATLTPTPTPTTTAPPVPVPPVTHPPDAPRPIALFSPTKVVHFEVVAFAVLALLGGQSMLRGIAGLAVPGAAAERRPSGGKATSVKVKDLKSSARSEYARGDQSPSWNWPGTYELDALALTLPARIAARSPLLARVLVDASYLRAMFGAMSLVLPVAGLVLGGLALANTHGYAVPPSTGLVIGLSVLGVFDALAGALAATVFVVGVLVTGHLDSAAAVRTMIGLVVIFFAAPLIAGAARPLRRLWQFSALTYRQRIADLTIASLIGAWAVQKMIQALPGLAQQHLPIAAHANTVAWCVLGAGAGRILFETAAAFWYPRRLSLVQSPTIPKPSPMQRVLVAVVRTGVFLFIVVAFIGNHWQLWVGGVLFLVPSVVSIYEDRLPNSPALYRWLPRGLVKLVIMLFVGAAFGAYVLRHLHHTPHAALDAFVLLTIPGLVVGAIELFGRDGDEPEEGWLRWLAGVAVLALGIAFATGYLS